MVLLTVSILLMCIPVLHQARRRRGRHVQVLEVATRELVVGGDLDLALTGLLDNNVVAKVVGAALDLDTVLKELLESGDVEDLVAGRLRSIDDVLVGSVSNCVPRGFRRVKSSSQSSSSSRSRSGYRVPSWSASGPCPTSSVEK